MFEGRIQLIGRHEIPGAAFYNGLARAVKFARSISPYLLLEISPAGGMEFDLDLAGLRAAMPGLPAMPFLLTVAGDRLSVGAGIVWLCDRKLEAAALEDVKLTGDLSVWVTFNRSEASIMTGRDFPDALDSAAGMCNFPLGIVLEGDNNSYSVLQRHLGDMIVLRMPHILIPGFDGTKRLMLGCVNGSERYYETTDCEDDDLV